MNLYQGHPKQGPVVAIDGPAGTGKSYGRSLLAERLGYIHVDTGALYRSIAYLSIELLKRQVGEDAWLSPSPIGAASRSAPAMLARTVHLEFRRAAEKPFQSTLADGHDVTELFEHPKSDGRLARVGASGGAGGLLGATTPPGMRRKIDPRGKRYRNHCFPDAEVKFFLTADVDTRAKRRLIELEAAGADAPSFGELRRQIAERDRGDRRGRLPL